jgi:tetratricopeptide (TPR) repeat protein
MPTYALAQFSLGMTLGRLGRSTEAIGPFRAVLKLAPDSAEAHSGLGLALADEGHFDDAMVEFETARALAEEQGKLPLLESVKARMRMMPPRNARQKMPSSPTSSPTRPRQSP